MTGQGASKAVLGHDPMPGQIASYIMRANIGWRRPIKSWLLASILWPAFQMALPVQMGIMYAKGVGMDMARCHVTFLRGLVTVPLSNIPPLYCKWWGAAWCGERFTLPPRSEPLLFVCFRPLMQGNMRLKRRSALMAAHT